MEQAVVVAELATVAREVVQTVAASLPCRHFRQRHYFAKPVTELELCSIAVALALQTIRHWRP